MSSSWHVEEVAARQAAVDEVKAAISTSEEAAGKELSTQGESRPLDTTTWRSGFWGGLCVSRDSGCCCALAPRRAQLIAASCREKHAFVWPHLPDRKRARQRVTCSL